MERKIYVEIQKQRDINRERLCVCAFVCECVTELRQRRRTDGISHHEPVTPVTTP